MWRLGENLNVKYSLAATLVSGLSGLARLTCIIMDAEQLHPPAGDGPVAPEHFRLDNVMNVLRLSLVEKLPACKHGLLHAIFPSDSLARTKGEPIAMWLVRYYEQLGKLKRVGVDIVTALTRRCWLGIEPGWSHGETELSVWCPSFLMTPSTGQDFFGT